MVEVAKAARIVRAHRRFNGSAIAAVLALASQAGVSVAQPSDRLASTVGDEKATCLAQHESSQLLGNDGRLREARENLRACSRQSCPEFVRADCVRWLEALNARLPSVVLVVRSPAGDEVDVDVSVDGELVTRRLDGKAMDLDPGVHQFRFERPSYVPVEQQLLVVEGEKNRRVVVLLSRARRAARAFGPGLYAFSSGAALALATFAYFGVTAIHDRQALAQRCAPFCSDQEVAGVRTKFLVADVSLGVALLATGGALFMALSRWPTASDRASPTASLPHWSIDVPTGSAGARVFWSSAF